MLVKYGRYQFGRRRIAYRRGICHSCRREGVAEQWRSFDWLHIFWIPLVPFGVRRTWICTRCGEEWTFNLSERIAGMVLVGLVLAAMCYADLGPEDAYVMWGIRAVLGVVLVWLS